MPELFTNTELESYAQKTVPAATGALVLELVTAEIRGAVGGARYDALTNLGPLRPVALDLARRMVTNPDGKRSTSRQIDDYAVTDTYASETVQPAELTDGERDRVRRAAGLDTGGAFSIRPSAPAARCAPAWRRC